MVLNTPESIIEQASTQYLLDYLIDESVRTSARRPIMMQFDPSSGWIWKRWKGTIFSETWDSCVAKMVYACLIFVLCRTYPSTVKETLSGFHILWGQLLSVTTFTLTFFVNQSYALWRKCYDLSRRLQGRLHDMDMTLAVHAVRQQGSDPYAPTRYTKESRQLLQVVARWVRLFNLLTYASFTRSHRPILTPMGMRRLVDRGLMTPEERVILTESKLPATQRHNAVLLWIMRAFVEGREAGLFTGGAGFEDQFLEKAHVTRASYGAIGDELHGRMPLAYTHIVQVLVDLVLWMYPLMAFSSGMSGLLCVLGTGLLTIGYQGLFDLAKQFLDPYDNESYGKGEDPLMVDTLIAESNAGSVRWMHSLDQFPISSARVKDGMLEDSIFPLRGYSVQEIEQMEEEKQRKEMEEQERLEREQEEKRRAEEHRELVQKAANEMIKYKLTSNQMDRLENLSQKSIMVESTRGVRVSRRVSLPGAFATANLESSSDVAQFVADASLLEGALPHELVPPSTAVPTPQAFMSIDGDTYTSFLLGNKIESVVNGVRHENESDDDAVDQSIHFTKDTSESEAETTQVLSLKDALSHGNTDGEGPEALDFSSHVLVGTWESSRRDNDSLSSEANEDQVVSSSIFTYDDYERHIKDILEAAKAEMIETEAIMNAPPGANSVDIPEIDDLTIDEKSIHDDNGESEDHASSAATTGHFIAPPVKTDQMLTEHDILGNVIALVNASSDGIRTFDEISEERERLLRSNFETEAFAIGSTKSNTTAPDELAIAVTSDVSPSTVLDNYVETRNPLGSIDKEGMQGPVYKGLELTELADLAAIPEESKAREEIDELIETQAILNAPCAADYVDIPGEDDSKSFISNTTDADDDYLAVLEMDTPVNTAELLQNEAANEMEREAISVHDSDGNHE
ncbi:hypothetical protein FisN_39Hh011 [Fistulifera solaris]|uniref:Bestrophin homolog n=1 Tax=Fistulifera solaris TaxID=1519565 RepID=A0A1Z5KAA7_FISSO|nr:hypothetical protein FisN_39Hh011 [Fistulifera solaris]|eukprot:GAX23193.1 hypothetical protein FisN_39Hh011 [Fistulifera solaris]